MNVAYIITAYKNGAQLARLVQALNTPTTAFFIHIDLATPDWSYREMRRALATVEQSGATVRFLERRRTPWGCFAIIEAMLAGLSAALQVSVNPFDYFVHLTGHDYPLRSNAEIHDKLGRSGGQSFMLYWSLPFEKWRSGGLDRFQCRQLTVLGRRVRVPVRTDSGAARPEAGLLRRGLNLVLPRPRPFLEGLKPFGGGAAWWLARSHVEYLLGYLRTTPSYTRYFRRVSTPDEMFFQTLLLNSPVAARIVNDDLLYQDWQGGGSHPRVFRCDDMGSLLSSGAPMARKFDENVDAHVLDLIDAVRAGRMPNDAGRAL
jgi:hypothetical protein